MGSTGISDSNAVDAQAQTSSGLSLVLSLLTISTVALLAIVGASLARGGAARVETPPSTHHRVQPPLGWPGQLPATLQGIAMLPAPGYPVWVPDRGVPLSVSGQRRVEGSRDGERELRHTN